MSNKTLYLRSEPDGVAPLVLLSGDPARVDRAAALLDGGLVLSQNREFKLATGAFNGTRVTIASGGIGAPSTAIAVHELVQLGAQAVVRIGTMMGVRAPLGSAILSTGAARFEGTSARYLAQEYPAIPDWALTHQLAEAGRAAQFDVQLGLTASYDAFYRDMAPELVELDALDLTLPERAGVLGMDMEAALLFTLGMVLGVATAAMCLVTVQAQPHALLPPEQRAAQDERLVCAALTGLVAYGAGL
jgi:uridine phosphorylase